MDIFGSKFRLAYIETIAVATSCVQRVYLYRVQKIGVLAPETPNLSQASNNQSNSRTPQPLKAFVLSPDHPDLEFQFHRYQNL